MAVRNWWRRARSGQFCRRATSHFEWENDVYFQSNRPMMIYICVPPRCVCIYNSGHYIPLLWQMKHLDRDPISIINEWNFIISVSLAFCSSQPFSARVSLEAEYIILEHKTNDDATSTKSSRRLIIGALHIHTYIAWWWGRRTHLKN